MPVVFKSGSLILLEPSGPVQACNGIALPYSPLIASALDPDILKVPLVCVDAIKIACVLKPKHVAMVKNICCV